MFADHLLKIKNEKQFKETGDSRYIHQNKLDKACLQHDMAYGDFKDLSKRRNPDHTLHNKAFNIAKYSKYDEYQRRIATLAYKFSTKSLPVLIF